MIELIEGHRYELDNFDKNIESDSNQKLQFIHKVPMGAEFKTLFNGTTNEEVLAVLIKRMNYLQGSPTFSCRENAIVITKLEEALMWLNKRTEDRKARNVEGKLIK